MSKNYIEKRVSFFISGNETAHFVKFKFKPTEGSSERANKINILHKKIERKSDSVKLFRILKFQKHLVNEKY
jgi:hypothetical protein